MLRTSLPATDPGHRRGGVASYKGLRRVERFFRTLNSELDVRPIRHRLADRVRAHMFLRMLSYYLSWHMKQALRPNPVRRQRQTRRAGSPTNPVAAAVRSRALAKAAPKRTPEDIPVHSFTSLLADLATICLNTIAPADPALPGFRLVTTPTAVQRQAFELLGVCHRHGVA